MRVIELNKYRRKNKSYSITEKENYFHCAFNKRYKHAPITGIKLGEVYAVIHRDKSKGYSIDALHFFKDNFTLPKVIEWLEKYDVTLMKIKSEVYYLDSCKRINAVTKLDDTFLISYIKGKESLKVDEDELLNYMDKLEQEYRKPLNITLIINDEQIDYIPKIRMDKRKDVLIVNGSCIVADYIDEYNGNLGFYLNSNPALPVSFVFTEETHVYVDIIFREQGKVIIVEYDYEIQLL